MLQGVPRGSNAKISRDNQDAFEESGGKTKLSGRGAAFIKWLCSDLTKHGWNSMRNDVYSTCARQTH